MLKKDKNQAKDKRKTFDWNSIHKRMNEVHKGIEHGWALSPEEKKERLKERAARYTRRENNEEAAHKLTEVVVFTLAYETDAGESGYVTEVYPLTEVVYGPSSPDFVLGIINVRGRIVSVVELKKFFDLPSMGITELNKVIILRDKEMEFGILSDDVTGMKNIDVERLQKPLLTMSGIREQYLRGLTNDPMSVLDAAKLLHDPRMRIEDK